MRFGSSTSFDSSLLLNISLIPSMKPFFVMLWNGFRRIAALPAANIVLLLISSNSVVGLLQAFRQSWTVATLGSRIFFGSSRPLTLLFGFWPKGEEVAIYLLFGRFLHCHFNAKISNFEKPFLVITSKLFGLINLFAMVNFLKHAKDKPFFLGLKSLS